MAEFAGRHPAREVRQSHPVPGAHAADRARRHSPMIGRRAFLGMLPLAFLTAPLGARAQEAGRLARIGVLFGGSPPDPFVEAFKQGLRELGYVEGRNVR
jgi:hypothetical protein